VEEILEKVLCLQWIIQ